MAITSTLDIYKVTYQLLLLACEVSRNMPRDLKAQMGGEIRTECVAIVVLIYRANAAADKVPHIARLLERLQVVELLFRISKDLRLIAVKQYAAAIALTTSIGKQATGWRNHYSKAPAA